MIYVFTADDGSEIERNLPMAEAPPFGTKITEGGKVYTRHPSTFQPKVTADRHFVAWSQAPVLHRDGTPTGEWDPETPCDRDPRSISYGMPVCDSWKDIDNLKKQSGGAIEYED